MGVEVMERNGQWAATEGLRQRMARPLCTSSELLPPDICMWGPLLWKLGDVEIKEISPGCSLEGLMLKLKLQYFGHLMQRVGSLEKTLNMGGIGGRRERPGWPRVPSTS